MMVCPQTEKNRRNYPNLQDWDNNTRTKACSLTKALDFELVSQLRIYHVLAIMEGITLRLLSSSIDIYDAFCMASTYMYNISIYFIHWQ